MEKISVEIQTQEIRLDAVLKFSGVVGTGGEAKQLIQSGQVRVNGSPETRRGTHLSAGDRVELLDADGRVQVFLQLQAAAG